MRISCCSSLPNYCPFSIGFKNQFVKISYKLKLEFAFPAARSAINSASQVAPRIMFLECLQNFSLQPKLIFPSVTWSSPFLLLCRCTGCMGKKSVLSAKAIEDLLSLWEERDFVKGMGEIVEMRNDIVKFLASALIFLCFSTKAGDRPPLIFQTS